jgi:hypothetical protein
MQNLYGCLMLKWLAFFSLKYFVTKSSEYAN